MGEALYGSGISGGGGYYKSASQKSARRGDYITSVETGPLFGLVISRALDSWWEDAGKPAPFYVFDVGAGVGSLGRSVLRANPACLSALKYVMVEQSEHLAAAQQDLVEAEPDIFESRKSFGKPVGFGVVIANELLDNLPVRLLEKTADGWAEVFVRLGDSGGLGDSGVPDVEGEELKPANPDLAQTAELLVLDAPIGSRIPIAGQVQNWLKGALGSIRRGRVLVLDYGVLETRQLASRPVSEWLRTYFAHKKGLSPYENIGSQDITCEVPFDQLEAAASFQSSFQTQAEFLTEWGILDLLPDTAKTEENIPLPTDLKSIELHSRKKEAEALLDPTGLGAHIVAQWLT